MEELRKHSISRRKIHILITAAVMIFIFVHSAMPGEVSGNESRYFAEILASVTGMSFEVAHFIVRKAAHFTEFTILGLCLSANFYDLKGSGMHGKVRNGSDECGESNEDFERSLLYKYPKIGAWAAGTLYACTDEFHQLFVEGRSCEFRDVCIDAAGVALGVLIGAGVRNIQRVQDRRR